MPFRAFLPVALAALFISCNATHGSLGPVLRAGLPNGFAASNLQSRAIMASGYGSMTLDQIAATGAGGNQLTDQLRSLGMSNPEQYLLPGQPHWQCAEYVDAVVAQGGGRAYTANFSPVASVTNLSGQQLGFGDCLPDRMT